MVLSSKAQNLWTDDRLKHVHLASGLLRSIPFESMLCSLALLLPRILLQLIVPSSAIQCVSRSGKCVDMIHMNSKYKPGPSPHLPMAVFQTP